MGHSAKTKIVKEVHRNKKQTEQNWTIIRNGFIYLPLTKQLQKATEVSIVINCFFEPSVTSLLKGLGIPVLKIPEFTNTICV